MSRRQQGFTLIELLVVVVIIGILAGIAVPKYSHARERAKRAVLTSDLRNLETAEESYFYDHKEYSDVLDSLRYSATPGVIVTLHEATNTGWSASATQPSVSALKCAVFFGEATAVSPATAAGTPACQ